MKLAGAVSAAMALRAPVAAAASAYRPSIPSTVDIVPTCDVGPNGVTTRCYFPDLSKWPRPPTATENALLKDLNAHPIYLPDARPGAAVEVLIRRRFEHGRPVEVDAAPPAPANAPLIGAVTWKLVPDGPELAKYYPDRAFRNGIGGSAIVDCQVGPAGDLVHCWVSGEEPNDQGFGTGLLKITICLQVSPTDAQDVSLVGRPIRIGALFGTVSGHPNEFGVNLTVIDKR
ncbi:MAG TPA: hypothetical protein VGH15_00035 [Caulobacteraceae bacterium]|jgi:hypothetical protein